MACFIPFYPVGVTSQRALRKPGWVIGGLFLVLFYIAATLSITLIRYQDQRKEEDNWTFAVVAFIFVLILVCLGTYCRNEMRTRFNIPGDSFYNL